jgi:CRISPR-associated protein Cas5
MNTDIKYLLEPPNLIKNVVLTIQPLAPLSMVNSMPGSYYKTEHAPDKFMLCGLFENILNLHLAQDDRNAIRNRIKKYYEKEYKINYEREISNVGYRPIINHLFEIDSLFVKPQLQFYEDVWTQHLIGADERHLKGVVNYDWRIENDMIGLKKRNVTQEKNRYFVDNKNRFPRYYRSPQQREFLIIKGYYGYKLKMTLQLFDMLALAVDNNNIGYLGTSEGWVNLLLGDLT